MRLLLVEDDPRIARDIERVLEANGYVVETVRDGEEAWFRGDTEDYVAVILDLGLPKMDGLSVLKRWRANGRRMPVLILTARGSWAERVDGIVINQKGPRVTGVDLYPDRLAIDAKAACYQNWRTLMTKRDQLQARAWLSSPRRLANRQSTSPIVDLNDVLLE